MKASVLRRVGILVLAVSILGTLIYLGYRVFPGSHRSVPAELKNALFIRDDDGEIALLVAHGRTLTPVTDQPAHVLEATRVGEHVAMITGSDGIFSVVLDGTVLTTTPFPKRHIALSPLGDKVAYAQSASTTVSSNAAADWNVVVIDTATGAQRLYVQGFSPFFFDEDSLVTFTPVGMKLYAKLDETHSEIIEGTHFTDVNTRISIAPNRRGFLWMEPNGKTIIKYASIPGITVRTYTELPPKPESFYVLGNEVLYELEARPEGTKIWKSTLAQPKPMLLYTAPEDVRLRSLIL
jgi:hypothetical protein